MLFLFAAAATAQDAVYTQHCAACHGENGQGSAQGPKLAGSRSVRSRSAAQLRTFIYQGAPSSGMPSFHLPDAELDRLTAFVHSLNSPVAENPVQGSVEAGQEFFFGRGQCGECHMVRGRGKAVGPDLSNVAREMTLNEIREVLRDPNSRVTPGYQLVSVALKDGRTLRGFARGRTNSDLQLNPHTGEMKWHYQFTPHDVHDWDATEPPVLIDTEYRGKPRKLLLHADRNGFFYVLDRITGEMLLAKAFAKRMTWTRGIGADGRPLPPPEANPALDCPVDAANWDSVAFSPVTRLFYVVALEMCRVGKDWKGAEPKLEPPQRFLRAIDIDTGNVSWEIPLRGVAIQKMWPGVMATAGGLVFYSDPNGTFAAADERTGKTLWHFPTNVPMKASPMTFTIDGKQFVATVAGPNILCFGL
jgi:putative heme-binding domain-containing protein